MQNNEVAARLVYLEREALRLQLSIRDLYVELVKSLDNQDSKV